jgi:hypothetical protein
VETSKFADQDVISVVLQKAKKPESNGKTTCKAGYSLGNGIKMHLSETVWEGEDRITNKWQAFVNTVMKHPVPYNFVTRRGTQVGLCSTELATFSR